MGAELPSAAYEGLKRFAGIPKVILQILKVIVLVNQVLFALKTLTALRVCRFLAI